VRHDSTSERPRKGIGCTQHPGERAWRRAKLVAGLAVGGLFLGFVGLLGRVTYLQVRPPQPLRELAGVQNASAPIQARRGNILDRKGRVLATTGIGWELFVDPAQIDQPAQFPVRVGNELSYEPAWVAQQVYERPSARYVVLDRQLSPERHRRAKELRLAGLGTRLNLVRRYPMGPVGGQVLGFVGTDGIGLEGLELLYDEELTGQPGSMSYLCDSRRNALWLRDTEYKPARPGRPVQLALDAAIQGIAEQQLAATCQKFEAAAGQLVVMDPRTGEILAMANYPGFDPSLLASSKPDLRRNRCVTDVFEPGSSYKPFVWSKATEAGVARPGEMINCGPGFYVSPVGRRLRDAHALGMQTWAGVLIHSSNIGMAIVGQRLGERRMFEAVRAFGFGQETGSKLPGEIAGIVNPLKQWNHYSVTSVPMGQEVGVTALQMVRAYCALANDGMLVTPRILLAEDGKPADEPIYERVLSEKTARLTRQVLRQVVSEGTGQAADSQLYDVFGKTGTAQIADRRNGGYLDGAYVSVFVGGAPFNNPRGVVGCFVHHPHRRKGYYGGTVSAPAVREVIDQTLQYLGVPPDKEKASQPNVMFASLD